MTTGRSPVTAAQALFNFYDIEALSNVFTLCAYTPQPGSGPDALEIFFLVDDQALLDALDPQALYQNVVDSNPGLPAVQARLWNLGTEKGSTRLAEVFGLSNADQVCHRTNHSDYPARFRPVCDTDSEYDPARHPFLTGYNSLNYDTTMTALFLNEVFPAPHNGQGLLFQPTTARTMRDHNDRLFNEHIEYMPGYLSWDGPAAKIRRAMLHSGRHIDASRLNELQFKVSLKRLLGMLGRQIKESEKLSHNTTITTIEDFYELIAYNVSDCLGLAQLFQHPAYASNFDLKAALLAQYPETVFEKNGSIRRDRLSIDSSSAKFVGRILAPYESLSDIESVSYWYPDPEVAKERGVEPFNVLDECRRFFEETVAPDPRHDLNVTHAQREAHRQFMQVFDYYRSIEGQNFNDSEEYRDKFSLPARQLRSLPKTPNNVPYFHADATPSSCFATFSTGGIHGAEADMGVFTAERIEHLEQDAMILRARQLFPEAVDFVAAAKEQHNQLTLPDGTIVDKRLVLLGSDPAKVKYRKPKKDEPEQAAQIARAQSQLEPAELLATQRPDEEKLDVVLDDGTVLRGKVVLANTTATKAAYREEPAKKSPELFVAKDDGSTRLHPKFTRTSAGLVIHEDFTSYYPNLLRNMRAFWNPELGEDRYAKIFFDKERYGRQMKDPGLSADEYARLNTLRNGTKLILNSASGAGDAGHKTPIRMNNRIISMRIIGQLFSWMIGQAQTSAGARIISTNTDGLYSIVGGGNGFDEEINNRVLAERQAAIGVDIEPELMFLISKDSNNRLELGAPKRKPELAHVIRPENILRPDGGFNLEPLQIHAAGGGTLACFSGPTPTKSLAHPAVTDFALARYLQLVASSGEAALAEPFDPALGKKVVLEAVREDDPVKTLLLFQNVLAASRGSITYPFAADPIDAGNAFVEVPRQQDPHDVGPGSDPGTTEELDPSQIRNPRALQMVNRVFVVRSGTPGAVSLHNAGAWKVTPVSQAKRRESGEAGVRRDPIAMDILQHHGWAKNRTAAAASDGLTVLPDDQDVVVRRINGIDPSWSMVVVNDDLRTLSESRTAELISALDLDVYVQMLGETFTKNWRNDLP